MSDKKNTIVMPLSQALLLLLGILIIYLVVDVGRQVVVAQQRKAELREVAEKIEAAKAEQARLDEQLAYAQSPWAAEAWARRQGWAKANEVPVILVAPEGETPQTGVGRRNAPIMEDPIRQAWFDLFFGSR